MTIETPTDETFASETVVGVERNIVDYLKTLIPEINNIGASATSYSSITDIFTAAMDAPLGSKILFVNDNSGSGTSVVTSATVFIGIKITSTTTNDGWVGIGVRVTHPADSDNKNVSVFYQATGTSSRFSVYGFEGTETSGVFSTLTVFTSDSAGSFIGAIIT